jgi:hypothetical protein
MQYKLTIACLLCLATSTMAKHGFLVQGSSTVYDTPNEVLQQALEIARHSGHDATITGNEWLCVISQAKFGKNSGHLASFYYNNSKNSFLSSYINPNGSTAESIKPIMRALNTLGIK